MRPDQLDRLLDAEVPDERQPRLVIDDQVEVEVGQPDAHHVFVGFEFGPQLRVGVGPQVGTLHQLQQDAPDAVRQLAVVDHLHGVVLEVEVVDLDFFGAPRHGLQAHR